MIKFECNSLDIQDFYNENGYIIIKDLIEKDVLTRIKSQILSIFELGFSENGGGADLLSAAYKDSRREVWRFFAKRMGHVPAILSAAGSTNLYDVLKKIGLVAPVVCSYPEVRTDMPNDTQYQQPWHQDWRYGQGSLNAVTIWTPLHNMRPDLGPVALIPKTHKNGLYPYYEREAPRAFIIEDKFNFEKKEQIQANLNFGESVIFSQLLVHGSQNNISNEARLTFQMRFSDLAEEKYKNNYYKQPTSSSLVWDPLPFQEMDSKCV